MTVKATTKNTFKDDVLDNKKVVLLDVWAPWCGPCRGMEPILDELATETGDWLEIVKLNADDEMDQAQDLGVSGLPTFFVYKNGQVVASTVGATSKVDMLALVEQAK